MKYQLKLDDERIQMEVELLMQRRLQEEKDQVYLLNLLIETSK